MYKSIFVGLTLGIIAATLIAASIGVVYGQGSGMQIFVSPQDRDEDDHEDKVREIIDNVKDRDNSEKEEDVRDTIEKFKDSDDSKGDGDSGGEGVGVSPDDCRTVFRTSECGDIACTGPRCIALFEDRENNEERDSNGDETGGGGTGDNDGIGVGGPSSGDQNTATGADALSPVDPRSIGIDDCLLC